MTSVIHWLQDFINRPLRVFWFSLTVVIAAVVLDGNFIQLWSLHREVDNLHERIADAKVHSRVLEYRIQEAQQPEFIERQARDQLDLVRAGDLVFVFADETDVADATRETAR